MDSNHSELLTSNLFDVKDLTVVITGGGTGIGQMMTRALVANGVKKVYIVGRRLEVLETTAKEFGDPNHHSDHDDQHHHLQSANIIPIQADLTQKSSIEDLVNQLESKEDYIDILINNAAIAGPKFDSSLRSLDEIREALWSTEQDEAEEVLRTNVLGYFYTSVGLLNLLGNSPHHPQIINISSNASFARTAMLGILYSLSKASITHLTKLLATHLVSTNVRVNAIAPGLFPSELTAGQSDDRNQSSLKDNMGLNIPVGRPGVDKEIASLVLYLASKNQNYTSGSVILADGGVLNLMPSSY